MKNVVLAKSAGFCFGVKRAVNMVYEEIEKRLADIKGRGVVLKDGQTLYDLFMERTPLYEKYADVRVLED